MYVYHALGPKYNARPSGMLTAITIHMRRRMRRGTGTMRRQPSRGLKAGRSHGTLPARDDHGDADADAERDDEPRRDLRGLLVLLVEVPDQPGRGVEPFPALLARHRLAHLPARIKDLRGRPT